MILYILKKIEKSDPEIIHLSTKSNVAAAANVITKKKKKIKDDLELLVILNKFVFYTFLLFIIGLNVACLSVLPYYVRKSITFDKN